jgi:hypothetical protein
MSEGMSNFLLDYIEESICAEVDLCLDPDFVWAACFSEEYFF